jgi:membrane protein implicated in regulation of membrane protease activity
MQTWWIWLIAGIGLVILEMATGTLYLLFIGISALLGAAAAYAGAGPYWQLGIFAAPAVAACLWGLFRRRHRAVQPMSFDVGQWVSFEHWVSPERRLARVSYRGSSWDATVVGDAPAAPGDLLLIKAVEGSHLRIARP